MSTPFFIVGSGRSGSTLLRVILCAHPDVTIPPETYFIAPLLERLPVDDPLDSGQVATAREIITGHYRWPDMGLSEEEFSARVARLSRPSLRDILNVIYNFHLDREGKTVWGDKTPPYVSIVPGLARLYPEARFIHLVRDGRDVTKSFQATGWCGRWLHENTREWRAAIRAVQEYARSHPEIRIHEVRYEDLVLETEDTIRDVCRHLGIRFEPCMLDWTDGLDRRIPEREAHIHRKLGRKPQAADINRWKREMSWREQLVTEAFIADELKSSGYPLRFDGPAWAPALLACRWFCRLCIPVYSLARRAGGLVYRRLTGSRA